MKLNEYDNHIADNNYLANNEQKKMNETATTILGAQNGRNATLYKLLYLHDLPVIIPNFLEVGATTRIVKLWTIEFFS